MISKTLFTTNKRLILASASPRRKKMLTKLGLEFEVLAAEVDEVVQPGEQPEEFVQRVAIEKVINILT